MPRRRAPSGGGGGSSFGQQFLMMMMQQAEARRAAERQNQMANERMERQSALSSSASVLPGVQSGAIRPESLPPEIAANIPGGAAGLSGMAPSQQALEGPMLDQIGKANELGEVPGIQQLISQRAAAGPIGARQLPLLQPGARESEATQPSQLGPLTGTLAARGERVTDINRANELADDRALAMAKGTARESGLGAEQAAAESFGAQLSRKTQDYMNETHLLGGRRDIMDPRDVKQAGAVAGATSAAQAPYDRQILYGTGPDGKPLFRSVNPTQLGDVQGITPFPPVGGQATDAQLRAQGFLPSLINSDAGASMLERSGVQLNLGTQAVGNTPWLAGWLPEDQQKYFQNQQDFINFATLILTGVTARPDEYKRYTGTLFSVSGDTPDVVQQKQFSRQMFIKAVMARAQRGQGGTIDEVLREIQNRPDTPPGVEPADDFPPTPEGVNPRPNQGVQLSPEDYRDALRKLQQRAQ